MGKTAIEPAAPKHVEPLPAPTTRTRPLSFGRCSRAALTALASLRITVALFALSFVLVFAGTLAQIDQGVFTVVNAYFRTAMVWIPFQLFVEFGQVFFGIPRTVNVPGSFPFPGGWLLGGLLLLNLLAAHAVRFRVTWRRS